MVSDSESEDEKPSVHETKCRWSGSGNYRLIIWVWMMNEMSLMQSPGQISHFGLYVHGTIQTLAVIFIGIPLVYSEMCIAQYTGCNFLTMWNYFPLFRHVGYGTLFLIFLKTIYVMVLSSWYLIYTFYSAFDPPPWFLCDDFNNTKCMVKRVNVSIFQHCLEAQMLFNDDCGMKTASWWFFEREIGSHNTRVVPYYFFPWKQIIASTSISLIMIVLSIRKEKFIQVVTRILSIYICAVILILCCVTLSMSGSWYTTKVFGIRWDYQDVVCCIRSLLRGTLCLGSGTGMIVFLSNDVPFRSPATMTSICTSLTSLLVSVMFSLIVYGGVKTVSFYHGKEESVFEIGSNSYFIPFGSISEILTYFDGVPLWTFLWYSAIFFCLFCNLWILFFFLEDMLLRTHIANQYRKLTCCFMIFSVSILSWPFFHSDLATVLNDVTEIIQLSNCFFFALSLFWFYGFRKHNVDIIFMIGIKASYFWKVSWVLSPICLFVCLFCKFTVLNIVDYKQSYFVKSISAELDFLLLYIFISIYLLIIFTGLVSQLICCWYHGHDFRHLIVPKNTWGPEDIDLFKSRKMFVPEIMTTEFLYRQVRIHGYYGKKKAKKQRDSKAAVDDVINRDTEWCAHTSN